MAQHISLTSLVVGDYDNAIAFYVGKLGFQLIEDTALPDENKRWVVVSPSRSGEGQLLLAQAKDATEQAIVGKQAAGRVFLFLRTDDFWQDYETYQRNGVEFIEAPREEPYGTVVVFRDLYGNLWDLLQLR